VPQSNDENSAHERTAIRRCALNILEDRNDFLEELRKIEQLARGLFPESEGWRDPDFGVVFRVADATEKMPAGHYRATCTPEWLKECDDELNRLREQFNAELNSALKRIVSRFDES
jgi:hypothetical protein